jgi:hypothetical protein
MAGLASSASCSLGSASPRATCAASSAVSDVRALARILEDDRGKWSVRAPHRFGPARGAATKNDHAGAGQEQEGKDPDARSRKDRPRAVSRLQGSPRRTPQILEARHYRLRLRPGRRGTGVFSV